MRLLDELRRGKVIRMAGLNLASAWPVTRVTGTVLPMSGARSVALLPIIALVTALVVGTARVAADASSWRHAWLAMLYARRGQPDQALAAALAEQPGYNRRFRLALAYAMRGHAIDGDSTAPRLLWYPMSDPRRDVPRFKAVLKRMGLPCAPMDTGPP